MDFEESQMEGRKPPADDHVEEVLLQEDGLILARGSGLLGPDYQIYEDGKLYAHFLDRAVAEKQYGEIKELRNKTKGR